MVRRPPTLLGNARIFPSCITAILPLFIDWKGNDLVRKKCICPPLTHDPITTWFISPMSFHRFKCYEKKMIQSPLIHFLFLHIPRSGLWWFRSSKLTFIKKWHFWNYDSCPQKKQLQTNALMSMFKRRNQFSNRDLLSSLQSWFIPSIQLKF